MKKTEYRETDQLEGCVKGKCGRERERPAASVETAVYKARVYRRPGRIYRSW